MKKFARLFGVALGLAALAFVVSLVPQKSASGTVAAQVQVVNEVIPVNGTVTVGNTPTVNVGNSPTVTISGTPTVSLAGNQTVTIGGTPHVITDNLPAVTDVRNLDDPGRIPYQSSATTPCSSFCLFNFGPVPSGHRLVIQHVTGYLGFISDPKSVQVLLRLQSGAIGSSFFVSTGDVTAAFDQPVQLYFDENQTISVEVFADALPSPSVTQEMNLMGYLLDCGAAPCAPIAH
ncbi:MAG: hypothetical protein WBP79_03070 [Candidatus Acidiferrales bacterium]